MNFSITTCLNKQEYIKVMFVGLYKKPGFILATIIGAYFLITSILNYCNVLDAYAYSPLWDALLGFFLLLAPSIIIVIAVNQLKSNPSLLSDMHYTFTDLGMTVTGKTFKSEFSWEHIMKQKEIRNYLILYHTKKFGNFIDKSKLTTEQLVFIKSKIGVNS
ncbi:YcxB family protein [Mucilaginibacter psychrotolerans]|uniref:YcxB family protein n=1 Tax=Mucilaginibacter psychrotolerans TaxID=1524096 RepID=A0A4Y8S7S6_9SPHI|nr:YcxB family protein [Mucilaginibacter psychrotolerans]TFF34655.1 YcxB family protein [Mucilaginibacter psychrotolerans]